MAKFSFYYGDDPEVIYGLRGSVKFCWGDVEELVLDSFRLFVAVEDHGRSSFESDRLIGAVSGYVRNKEDTTLSGFSDAFFPEISENSWPLGEEWSGSFAAAAFSSDRNEVTLCNDVIGHFPLYYSRAGNGFVGGTSLIALGRALGNEPDAVGVLQRITVPFCNYGSRTPLKNVLRLMPGERLKWRPNERYLRREYDNSLCGEVIDTDVKTTADRVWDCLRQEITLAIGDSRNISVATSGGWDSRLVLGGLGRGKYSVHCLTYGSEELYETRIARKCADAIGASHESFPIEGRYFPSRQRIETLIKETESGNYFEWFGILEKARSSAGKTTLLLGDLCESIDGRYLTAFSTRKARVDSFLNGLIGKREVFEPSDPESFDLWRKEKIREITAALLSNLKNLSSDLVASMTEERIVEEIRDDLEASFARVEDTGPHFSAMYDELFIWFHRIRFLLGNQISWLGAAFNPASPGMSMRFLRLITRVHPRHRIRRRLMNAIARLPEFDLLARIPSAQIPFVSSRAPGYVRDLLWGLRSGLDQVLIRRSLRTKKVDGRQRVLRSLDYVKEYRRSTTVANVESWFSGKHIQGADYLRVVRMRGELDAWTLINVDITAPANISIILDLCSAEPHCAAADVRAPQVCSTGMR